MGFCKERAAAGLGPNGLRKKKHGSFREVRVGGGGGNVHDNSLSFFIPVLMALDHFQGHREIKRCISQFGCKFYTILFVYFYLCCVELCFLLWNLSDPKRHIFIVCIYYE